MYAASRDSNPSELVVQMAGRKERSHGLQEGVVNELPWTTKGALRNGMLWSEAVTMASAFGHRSGPGTFAVRADGTFEEIVQTGDPLISMWELAKTFGNPGLALPGSRIFTFGCSTPILIDTEKETLTVLGKRCWGRGTKAIVRPLSFSDTVLLFHEMGLFSCNVNDGSFTKLSQEDWKCLKAVVVDPEKDTAYAFHVDGVYKVDLSTGISETIDGKGWGQTMCAVWTSSGIIVLHTLGIFCFNVETGESRKLLSEGWEHAKHVVDAGDGAAFVFHSNGLYRLNLSSASYTKVEGSGSWCSMVGVWEMRPEVRCVNRVHRGQGEQGAIIAPSRL